MDFHKCITCSHHSTILKSSLTALKIPCGKPIGTEHNNSTNQLHVLGICKLAHSTTAQFTFLTRSFQTFTKADHIPGHKTYLTIFKRIEIMQCVFSDHDGLKLEISNRKETGKFQNM